MATTSTLANPLLSAEMLLLVAKWVLLLPAGLGVSGEPRLCKRKRTRVEELNKICPFATKLCLLMVSEGRVLAGRTAVKPFVLGGGR